MLTTRRYTTAEIAERCRVPIKTVLGWINSKQLTAIDVSRAAESKKPRWRITEQEIERFENGRSTKAPVITVAKLRPKPAQDPDYVQYF